MLNDNETLTEIPEMQKAESRYKTVLAKLAVFTVILLINQKFLYMLIYFPAQVWYAYAGEGVSESFVYALNWFLSDVSVYLVPSLTAYFLFKKERKKYSPADDYMPVLEPPIIFFSSCFLGSLASIITEHIANILDRLFGTGTIPDAMEGSLPSYEQTVEIVSFLIFVVILAPIFEELIFRNLLLVPLRTCGDGFAIVFTALLFSVVHGNFQQSPYAFMVGLLYGFLAVRSGSVIPTMILHLINNLLVSFGSYGDKLFPDQDWAAALSSAVGGVLDISFWLGLLTTVVIFTTRLYKSVKGFEISRSEKAKMILLNPGFYVAVVAMVLIFV